MRKPLIAGNWKMNMTIEQSVSMVEVLKEKVKDVTEAEIMVAPPYTALSAVAQAVKDSNIQLGAQNLHFEKSGAYTGEISAGMLSDIGCRWVIIGHSERRQYFGCTDEIVNRKLKAAVSGGLKPVVCIGETLEERETGKTFDILKKQLDGSLDDLNETERDVLTIAYEPVWAIGTGKTATSEQAEEAHSFIRKRLSEMYGREFSESVRILYGGSVKAENISELMKQNNIDGGLVGGASLDPDSFASILKF
ncbi:MAG: triose-phosphate isomerase [Elusimicrobiota bacterium]